MVDADQKNQNNPEGDPILDVESPETVDMRTEMEEMGLPPETEEEPEHSPEQEPENEQEKGSNQESENESPSESEQNPDKEWEFINPETGDPVPHQVDPKLKPIEDAIEEIH